MTIACSYLNHICLFIRSFSISLTIVDEKRPAGAVKCDNIVENNKDII